MTDHDRTAAIRARLEGAQAEQPYEQIDRHQVTAKAWSDLYQHAPSDMEYLLAENAELREAIAGSPEKAKRIALLVASATRLVQIERDDARQQADNLRTELVASETDRLPRIKALTAERDRLAAQVQAVRELRNAWNEESGDLVPPLTANAAWQLARQHVEQLDTALGEARP